MSSQHDHAEPPPAPAGRGVLALDLALGPAHEGLAEALVREVPGRRVVPPERPDVLVLAHGPDSPARIATALEAGAVVLLVVDADEQSAAATWLAEDRIDIALPELRDIIGRLHRLRRQQAARRAAIADRRALDDAVEQMERFSYAVSHDLKEPLRAITGFARLLETRHAEALEGQPAVYLQFVTDGAARLEAMLNALLQHSRLQRHEVDVQQVELAAVLRRVLIDIDHPDVALTASALPVVATDHHLAQVIMRELVANAVEFSRDADQPAVHVTADTSADGWALSVTDNGEGFDDGGAGRAYDMFARLHPRDVHTGIGAGLALARMAAAVLGGTIGHESEPGRTTFTARLPLRSGGAEADWG